MPQQRSLVHLRPDVGLLAGEGLRLANARGVAVLVYETARDRARQADLWRVGRTEVSPGVWKITGRVVTMAQPGESNHERKAALDAAPWEWVVARDLQSVEKNLDWMPFVNEAAEDRFIATGNLENLDPHWRVMVQAFLSVGFKWLGTSRGFREYVHFEKP